MSVFPITAKYVDGTRKINEEVLILDIKIIRGSDGLIDAWAVIKRKNNSFDIADINLLSYIKRIE